MKISSNDLMDKTSLVVMMLDRLDAERKVLEKRAERIRKLDVALVNLIQDGRITDTKDIEYAIALLNHSNLEVWEIVNKVLSE